MRISRLARGSDERKLDSAITQERTGSNRSSRSIATLRSKRLSQAKTESEQLTFLLFLTMSDEQT
jgi:hypothetical protein